MSSCAPIPGVEMMRSLRLIPDPWQIDVLQSARQRIILNCSRQAGKSTTVAVLALAEAMFTHNALVLILSRSHRQSRELFGIIRAMHRKLGAPLEERRTTDELTLENGSRIVCLPCKEETVRGYSGVTLLIIDEASRVPDDLYYSVRPMLAASNGRMICLSTPYGKRGFFWEIWSNGGDDWQRFEVPAGMIPRISPAFLEAEQRGLGESIFRREYCCSFEALEGLVYPNLARCVATILPSPHGREGPGVRGTDRWVGGIDFGYRNPFAAVWGYLTPDGVLVLLGEHYSRQKPLSDHARHLPRQALWYADPSGATERSELRRLGFTVRAAENTLRPGIAAVNARIASGMLLIRDGACPNLLAEASLYRYGDSPVERHAETPVDEHNHALSALRYLIMMIDVHRLTGGPVPLPEPAKPKDVWLSVDNELLWTPLVPRD